METNIKDENIESNDQFEKAIQKKPHSFVRVYMEMCPHCVELKPKWNQLVDDVNDDNNLSKQIQLISISEQYLNNINSLKEKVSGFPTLLFIKDGVVENAKPYEGDRDSESMLNFIKTNVGVMSGGGRKTNRRKKGTHNKKSRKTSRRYSKSRMSLRKRSKSRAGKNNSKSRRRTKTRNRK